MVASLQTQLTWIYSVGIGAYGVSALVALVTFFAIWWNRSKVKDDACWVLGLGFAALVFGAGLNGFLLSETLSQDTAMLDVASARWFTYTVMFALLAYALAIIYHMRQLMKWFFVGSVALWMLMFALCTLLSLQSETRRWLFFAFGLFFMVLTYLFNLLSERLPNSTDTTQKLTEEEYMWRTLIRVWVALAWIGYPVALFVGPFGNRYENLAFEAAWYLIEDVFAVMLLVGLMYWGISPLTESMRASHYYGAAVRRWRTGIMPHYTPVQP